MLFELEPEKGLGISLVELLGAVSIPGGGGFEVAALRAFMASMPLPMPLAATETPIVPAAAAVAPALTTCPPL